MRRGGRRRSEHLAEVVARLPLPPSVVVAAVVAPEREVVRDVLAPQPGPELDGLADAAVLVRAAAVTIVSAGAETLTMQGPWTQFGSAIAPRLPQLRFALQVPALMLMYAANVLLLPAACQRSVGSGGASLSTCMAVG